VLSGAVAVVGAFREYERNPLFAFTGDFQ